MLKRLSHLFNRAPKTGARKDDPMPDPTPTPQPDLTAHLSALADAMRQLAESQKTLVESVKPTAAPQPAPPPPSTDIAGDPTGGLSPAVLNAIDYSKLSPLQQITLGLRTTPRSGAD